MKKIWIYTGAVLLMTACGNSEKEYDATGTFEATEITVSAKASGELQSFTLSEGQQVSAQQQVGTIDTYQLQQKQEELDAAAQQLQANAAATAGRQLDLRKQLASVSSQIANARGEQKRFAELVKDGAAPRKQLDDINNQIRLLESQLTATREQLNANNTSLQEQTRAIEAQAKGVKAQKRQVQNQISNADILAPIAGTVLEKYVEQGEFVTVGKPLFKVADITQMYIRAYVTSAQLKNIKLGQSVRVMADYGGKKKQYEGVITWISSRSEFTPKTILTDDEHADLVYALKVLFKNDGYVKIGMYGEVKF